MHCLPRVPISYLKRLAGLVAFRNASLVYVRNGYLSVLCLNILLASHSDVYRISVTACTSYFPEAGLAGHSVYDSDLGGTKVIAGVQMPHA